MTTVLLVAAAAWTFAEECVIMVVAADGFEVTGTYTFHCAPDAPDLTEAIRIAVDLRLQALGTVSGAYIVDSHGVVGAGRGGGSSAVRQERMMKSLTHLGRPTSQVRGPCARGDAHPIPLASQRFWDYDPSAMPSTRTTRPGS
jgi:hypothetical protein